MRLRIDGDVGGWQGVPITAIQDKGRTPPHSARPSRDVVAAQSGPHGGAADAPSPDADFDNDAGLVRRAQSGDRAAFEALLRRHYDRLHRIAWRLTGSRHDAEDVVQDVCCALVDRLGSFRGEARFSTWIVGIVINACHDQRRRRATFGRLKEGLAVLAGLARPADGRDLFRRTWIASALSQLDPALRSAIVLVVGEGLTHAEAGEALGVAEATISWRLHEARRRLAKSGEEGDGS